MRFNDMLLKILEFIRDNYDNLFKTNDDKAIISSSIEFLEKDKEFLSLIKSNNIEDVKRLEKMSIKLNNLECLQEENLEDVVCFQDIIYEHRQQCFLIPDFIYSLRKRNYQKSENMIAMDLINKKSS